MRFIKSKFESNYNIHQNFYEDYLEKWDDNQTSYFKTFRQELPLKQSSDNLYRFIIGGLAIMIGIGIGRLKFTSRSKRSPLQTLTVQERKIFNLIRQGVSNQDISNECHIGLSTVKSHVSNIYTKLKIKSRKEAMDLEL